MTASKRSRKSPSGHDAKAVAEPLRIKDHTNPPTPKRRRTTAKTKTTPPLTPLILHTSMADLLNSPSNGAGDRDDAIASPLSRPADPHASNATLVTPGGTRVTAYPLDLSDSPLSEPAPNGLPKPSSTTSTLLSQACAHLITVEPKIAPLIHKHTCKMFSPSGLAEKVDPFCTLASGIIAQQVSGAAATSIKNKFISLFNEDDPSQSTFPTPAQVFSTDIPRLKSAGLSQRKAEYIHGLAEKFTTNELSTNMLLRASDEEVMEKLIAVRGLGKWSVEMFACFGLKRMDIFSTGDLGVQRGMASFMGKDVGKLKARGGGKWKYMSEKDMLEGSEKFRPYRSLFMWYMWRAEGVDVSAVEGAAAEDAVSVVTD
jgi:DNA-3-methyladenine glycosylase II